MRNVRYLYLHKWLYIFFLSTKRLVPKCIFIGDKRIETNQMVATLSHIKPLPHYAQPELFSVHICIGYLFYYLNLGFLTYYCFPSTSIPSLFLLTSSYPIIFFRSSSSSSSSWTFSYCPDCINLSSIPFISSSLSSLLLFALFSCSLPRLRYIENNTGLDGHPCLISLPVKNYPTGLLAISRLLFVSLYILSTRIICWLILIRCWLHTWKEHEELLFTQSSRCTVYPTYFSSKTSLLISVGLFPYSKLASYLERAWRTFCTEGIWNNSFRLYFLRQISLLYQGHLCNSSPPYSFPFSELVSLFLPSTLWVVYFLFHFLYCPLQVILRNLWYFLHVPHLPPLQFTLLIFLLSSLVDRN